MIMGQTSDDFTYFIAILEISSLRICSIPINTPHKTHQLLLFSNHVNRHLGKATDKTGDQAALKRASLM